MEVIDDTYSEKELAIMANKMIEDSMREASEEDQIESPECIVEEKKPKKKAKEIFNEEEISALARGYHADPTIEKYQEAAERCIPLMDYIISEFDLKNVYCDASDLRNELMVKMPHYFKDFAQRRGRLFSYLSTCFKNYLNSYITRLSTRRLYNLPENSEETFGYRDVEETIVDYAPAIMKRVNQMAIRNIDFTTIRVYRYYACAVREGFIDKKSNCIRTVALMYDFSEDTCEFLYTTFMYELRTAMLDDYEDKVSIVDLHKVLELNSLLPELVDCIGNEATEKLITMFGGVSIKIPRLDNINKMNVELKIYKALIKDDSEESIARISRITGMQKAKVVKTYESMCKTMSKLNYRKGQLKLREVEK